MKTRETRKNPRYIVLEQAERDIDDIAAYIAQDNPSAAIRLVDRFYQVFELLAANPAMGHTRRDLADGNFRFWQVKPRFLVIYLETAQLVIIVRVMPADMDIAVHLRKETSLTE